MSYSTSPPIQLPVVRSKRRMLTQGSGHAAAMLGRLKSEKRSVASPASLRLGSNYDAQTTQTLSELSMSDHHPSPYAHDSAHEFNNSISTNPMSSHQSTASIGTMDTQATSMLLAPLQIKGPLEDLDELEPLEGEDPHSFDLVQPPPAEQEQVFSLEARSILLFSRDHLDVIFSEPTFLIPFTAFLSNARPQSVPTLVYYLDALKAMKAIAYANAVTEALAPIENLAFTNQPVPPSTNSILEEKASKAFQALVEEDLPAYITHQYIKIVSVNLTRRVMGTLPPHLRETSEGLAEVFCLTDPSRADNPIIFASEEFHRTTQYGTNYAIGRNCRFLQGPLTSPHSIRRLRDAVKAGKDHCETFLNYRRDGSPFMNMLMTAPLLDSKGKVRYFLGAQVDVSGLAKNCIDMPSLQRLVIEKATSAANGNAHDSPFNKPKKDEFRDLCEMLNHDEIETVRRWGSRMHRESLDDDDYGMHKSRLLLKDSELPNTKTFNVKRGDGVLSGVFQNYLLLRPHPSLRILFASPTLRVPGILQSPFMNRIGGSSRVRGELTAAFAEGRGVTAKVRWITKFDEEGRSRWIHCTPLLGSNGHIGVWMVIIIDDEKEMHRRWRQAPPVNTNINANEIPSARDRQRRFDEESGKYSPNNLSLRSLSPFSLGAEH